MLLFVQKAIIQCGLWGLSLWIRTFRFKFCVDGVLVQPKHFSEFIKNQVCVFGLYHQDLPIGVALGRFTPLNVMVSASHDGDYLNQLLEFFDFSVVRGSSSRGFTSLRLLLEKLHQGECVIHAMDGPKGPAKIDKPGAQWLIKQSQDLFYRIDVSYECSVIQLKTWDKMKWAYPWGKITVNFNSEIL